jgi:hypothetical protein
MVRPLSRTRRLVTLVVYGWRGNQPGTLSWVFPSVGAAMRAVKALRNAASWLIVPGERDLRRFNLDEAKRHALVLAEAYA